MATHRHKRETARRRPRPALIAGPLAVLATGAAVTVGVLGSGPTQDLLAVDHSAAAGSVGDRSPLVSRGGGRTADEAPAEPAVQKKIKKEPKAPEPSPVDKALEPDAVAQAINGADTRLWTTADLNLWTRPDDKADKVGLVEEGEKVLTTGRSMLGRQEVVLDGKARWVTSGYLTDEKPTSEPTVGGSCTNGTTVPSGVSPNIKAVHQSVCANFPEISTYGTFRSDGEHAQGIAVDIMVSGERGWEVAEFIRANYAELGVSYVIYSQRIWSVQRSSEGWRPMEDRGSVTANHYDHVHVTTY